MIIGEGETFDWSNVIAKPDLLECKDMNKESVAVFSHLNSLGDDESEWPVSTYYDLVCCGFLVYLHEGR